MSVTKILYIKPCIGKLNTYVLKFRVFELKNKGFMKQKLGKSIKLKILSSRYIWIKKGQNSLKF